MATTKTTKTAQSKKPSPAQLLKEQKIAAYQDRITHDEDAIAKMEEERSAVATTDVIACGI